MITATAHLINGDQLDLGPISEILLRELQAEGCTGRALVYALITDDWGAPPRFVDLEGTGDDGSPFRLRILCD